MDSFLWSQSDEFALQRIGKTLYLPTSKTVQEHVEDIKQTIKKAKEVGLKINLYLEDWSNGIQYSPQYVFI